MWHGQWSPPEDEVAFRNYFDSEDYNGKLCLECGAGSTGNSTKSLIRYCGFEGIFIEASKYAIRNFDKSIPHVALIHGALCSFNGDTLFRDVVSAPGGGGGNGSIYHTQAHKKELDGYGCVYEEYSIPCFTFSSIVEKFGKITYAVIDVEGAEVFVLSGMTRETAPDILCIEYPITGREKIHNLCYNLGYEFDFYSFNNAWFSRPRACKPSEWYGETTPFEDIE